MGHRFTLLGMDRWLIGLVGGPPAEGCAVSMDNHSDKYGGIDISLLARTITDELAHIETFM
jgi:hypothetical protein